MTWEELVAIALSFPGVVESTSYGTPAIKLGTKFLLRLREPGIIAVQRPSMDERDMLLEVEPDLFFITDHYRDYPYVLVRLDNLAPDHFRSLFETIWREKATKTQLAAYKSQ
ncbi:MmcQ/YjbR family DNA-binding protein [Pelagibacterium sp. 26DY04]|uniref:MmcQ/YjbR family DNA-binding protein n=1 Tax=Pelagibacterium sp. 26DY04 TaxID=2967130 RepID=UPI002815C7B2|nr:MmcQ/YjbR family DNA-binding protein [Pelagibacterium sp. 26DY04]WMT86258.1 MmcQ/YjbR family DNA-binding protein [Pelagibacterium sp. 26DY04]